MCEYACLFMAGLVLGAMISFHVAQTYLPHLLPCAEALEVQPISSALPFIEAGYIVGGVQYAPLAFSFNLSGMIDKAIDFEQVTIGKLNNSGSQQIMAHYAAVTFADEPLKELQAVQDIFATKDERQPRESVFGVVSLVTSGWALAEVFQVSNTVDKLKHNQIELAHVVDSTLDRLEQHDKLFQQVNASLIAVRTSVQSFSMYLGYFGYFSASREYARDVRNFARGINNAVNGHLSSGLVNTTLVANGFASLLKKARDSHLRPVFPDWQQVYHHQIALHYEQGMLHAIAYIPFISDQSDVWKLFHHTPTPWIYNNSLIELRPLHSLIVTDSRKKPLANLPASFLHQCRQVSAFHLCEMPIISSKALDTCETSLFRGDVAAAVGSCPVRTLPWQTTFASLNRTAFVLFTVDKLNLFEQCPGDEASPFEVEGLNVIRSNSGCSITSTIFATTFGGSVQFHQEVTILTTQEDFYANNVTVTVPILGALPAFDYQGLHHRIKQVIESDVLSHNWLLAIVLVLLVIIFAIFVAVYCLWRSRAKVISSVVGPLLNETVEKHFKKDTPEPEENSMPLEQINQEEIRDILFNSVKPRVEELVAQSASAYLSKLGL